MKKALRYALLAIPLTLIAVALLFVFAIGWLLSLLLRLYPESKSTDADWYIYELAKSIGMKSPIQKEDLEK
jgi:ABC-type uncharacterized transport system YnjBCD permease subunit